jgi:hypothetical protein
MRFYYKLGLSEVTSFEMAKVFIKRFADRSSAGIFRIFYLSFLLLTLLRAESLCSQPINTLTCLTNALQVRELDPETAGKNIPVRVSGVVTYYDAQLFNLFFQDSTAGIFVLVAAGQLDGQ